MDSGTVVGLVLARVVRFSHVYLLICSTRRKKRRLREQLQQRWQQPRQETTLTNEEEPEREDLAQEDSEGDGLMLFDDPMFSQIQKKTKTRRTR